MVGLPRNVPFLCNSSRSILAEARRLDAIGKTPLEPR